RNFYRLDLVKAFELQDIQIRRQRKFAVGPSDKIVVESCVILQNDGALESSFGDEPDSFEVADMTRQLAITEQDPRPLGIDGFLVHTRENLSADGGNALVAQGKSIEPAGNAL